MYILISALLTLFCTVVMADDYSVGELQINQPWSRALPPNAPAGAAYLVIQNKGETTDQLIAVASPVAAQSEMHSHVMAGEVMKMQQVMAVNIPAGGEVKFAPGGYHIMLMGLQQPLVDGEQFPLTLEFAKAGKVEVEVQVQQDAPSTAHQGH